MKYININGKITTIENGRIPVDNGAFRYGYGLFETMLIRDGNIMLKEYHWQRLLCGLQQLYFEIPPLMTPTSLEEELLLIVKKNKLEKLCRVRLQLFAVGGGLYGHENNQPGFLIECFPLDAESLPLNENGLVVGFATGISKSMDSISNLKSCNALIYAIAAQHAKEHKWNDALISNTSGNIIESTIANIFWIKDETVYTPPLSDGCIAGVMRRYILEKIPVLEKSLSANELFLADEVFLTNAVRRIKWLQQINDTFYKNEQVNRIYHSLF